MFTKELLTTSYTDPETKLTIRMTQEYMARFNSGHYHYAVMTESGHIVKAGESMAAPPDFRVSEDHCKTMLADALRYNRKYWQDEGFIKPPHPIRHTTNKYGDII